MNWILILEVLYVLLLAGVILRILFDTQTATKTAAYILLVLLVPFAGMFVHLAFGLNYRKRELYSKKLVLDQIQAEQISQFTEDYVKTNAAEFSENFPKFQGVNAIVYRDDKSLATKNNHVELLINYEEKFPELLEALQRAKHHIHLEYYIYENDEIGNAIAQVLTEKAKQGVKVRFIYDDFGSSGIRRKFTKNLRDIPFILQTVSTTATTAKLPSSTAKLLLWAAST